MKATMTDLHRRTAKVMRPVIHGRKTVEISEHGKVVAKIVPEKVCDPEKRYQAMRAFAAETPIIIAPRK